MSNQETQAGTATTEGDSHTPEISVVLPMYDEAQNVQPLVKNLIDTLSALDRPFEIILVDDGSRDETLVEIRRAEDAHDCVRGIYLARNYGQSMAMQAGFDAACGSIIATLDGDQQNDPADLPRMLEMLQTHDTDVVAGWRKNRKDTPIRKLFSNVANRLIRRLTGMKLHDIGCSLKVYRSDILKQTRLYGEMHRFLPLLLTEVGANMVEIEVNHHPRQHGRSKYRLDRTFRVLLDLFLILFFRHYVERPLHVFGGVGFLMLVPGGAILLYLAFIRLVLGESIGDRPLLTLSVLLVVVGVIMIGQGLLGELINRRNHHSDVNPHYLLKLPYNIARQARSGDASTAR